MAIKDLTGQRFGRLVVIELAGRRTNGEAMWLCRCDCGKQVTPTGSNLRRGNTTSCGCFANELKKKAGAEKHAEAIERKERRKDEAQLKKDMQCLDAFIKKFDKIYGERFEYVGGYPDIAITVKCKACGFERTRNRKKIFQDSNISCPACGNNRKGTNEASCEKCGAIFVQYSPQQILCKSCHEDVERVKIRARRTANKRLREANARKNGKVDYSITLSKLIERDNHICQLCGREVNENDYVFVGDTFVAGNDYPSIDHIKPLSKGGLHQWDNVQLAHRLCNSLKWNKED